MTINEINAKLSINNLHFSDTKKDCASIKIHISRNSKISNVYWTCLEFVENWVFKLSADQISENDRIVRHVQ